jgi:hypothetical protein
MFLAVVALLVAASASGLASAAPSASRVLEQRAVADLAQFTRWLRSGGGATQGFIGEVGWPGNPSAGGDARWNEVARAWYRAADRAGLTVAAWAAGDFWSTSYKLLVYAGASPSPQAAVVEAQTNPALRGVNLAGAEFATPVDESQSSFSNVHPGRYGVDYTYPSQATLDGLAARGVGFVRLPVRWERLQPALAAPLDPTEAGHLVEALGRARDAGLGVVVDMHNYGAYYLAATASGPGIRRPIGSREVPVAAFADLWRRLSKLLRGNPAVMGYGLMNEPYGMDGAGAWEAASRAAVAAVRATGDGTRIFVQSYDWGGTRQFAREHPRGPWIRDAEVWYEAHQYFDADRSARYATSFDEEAALAAGRR